MADIFISYSQQDRDWVERLVDALSAEGWEVWWDLEIRAGERFDRAIERTLRQVQAVVAVWSESSVDSDWVRDEAAWAQANNKLLTVQIEGQFSLPLKFSQVHAHSMAGWDGAADDPRFHKLVADIAQIAGLPASPASASETGPPALADEPMEPLPEPEVAPPTSPSEPSARPSPEPVLAEPAPGSASGRRGVVVGALSLAAAALAGGLYFATTRESPSHGYPPAPRPESEPEPGSEKDTSDPAPLSTFRDSLKDGSQGPEMVDILAGEFRMGCVSGKDCDDDELPVRTVRFDKPFAIGKHEVTFADYDRFAKATGKDLPDDLDWGRDRRPVINIAWTEAAAYCDWLGGQTGRRYRLPSEAQWEYAARAGTETPWSFGDDAAKLGTYAWYDGNSGGRTHPVGEKQANPQGLYDMHGNVWEWVQDTWNETYDGASVDGSARESGEAGADRVVRGGSWGYHAHGCRSAYRFYGHPDERNDLLGFRCARVQE